MSRPRKLLLIVLLLVAVALLAITTLADPQRFRMQLQQLAGEAIGKPLQIAGPMAWTFSNGPGLRAQQVSLLNPAGFADSATGPFAEAAEVQLSLSWDALLRGQINIEHLHLEQLQLRLRQAANGDNNWQFTPRKGAGESHFDPQLRINGLAISYHNASAEDSHGVSHISLPQLQLQAAAGKPLQLRTPLPAPHSDVRLDLQGPTLTALLADPLHWGLQGNLRRGKHRINGKLELDLSDQRPNISGTLALTTMAADSATPAQKPAPASAPATSNASQHRPAPPNAQTLTRLLHAANLQLQLSSDAPAWQGSAALSLTNGLLKVHSDDGPQASTLQAQLDATGPLPALQLSASAAPVDAPIDIGALAELAGINLGFDLTAQALRVELHSKGDSQAALLANLRGDIALKQLNEVMDLQDLIPQTIAVKQDDAGLHVDINGEWAGHPFEVRTHGDALQKLLDPQQTYSVDQHFIYGDNKQRFTGKLLRGQGERAVKGTLKLSGSNPSQFNRLLTSMQFGALPKDLKYRISANVDNTSNALTLEAINADIGGNHISGTLDYRLQTSSPLPLLSGELRTARLDLTTSSKPAPRQASSKPSLWHDINLPALPTTLQAAIKLHIGETRLFDTQVTKLHTTVTLRDNTLKLSPLTFQLDQKPLTAHFNYQYQDAANGASALLELDNPGFERRIAMGNFHPGTDLIIKGSHGHTRLRTHGRSLGHWQDNLELSNRLASFSATMADANGNTLSQLTLKRPQLSRLPGKPFMLNGSGRYKDKPLTVSGQANVTRDGKAPPFQLSADAGDLHIKLDGRLSAGPVLGVEALNIALSAEQQRSLPLLLRSSLAAQGPYHINARLSATGERYQLKDLKLRAGANDLGGRIDIDLGSKPHKLTLVLHSQRLVPTLKPRLIGSGAQAATHDGRAPGRIIPNVHLLPQVPQGWDADYQLSVNQLVLGENVIGRLQLKGKLQGDHLTLDPIRGRLNNTGSIAAKVDAHIADQKMQAQISARLEHLDLGFMLTRDDLKQAIPWYTDIELDLKGQGDYLPQFLASADGGLRFLGGHIDLDTSAMELWTLDLIGIAMPGLLKKKHEQGLLCSVAGFRVDDGIMTSEGMLFDTSQATITGSGSIDLRDETLHLLLTPKKKRISLFSIATPVALLGSFADPHASVPPSEMLLTAGGVALKLFQPWIIAGGLFASAADHNSSCAKTLSEIGKNPNQHKQHSPLSDALRELGSGTERLLE